LAAAAALPFAGGGFDTALDSALDSSGGGACHLAAHESSSGTGAQSHHHTPL
jgi:hypothetical protein